MTSLARRTLIHKAFAAVSRVNYITKNNMSCGDKNVKVVVCTNDLPDSALKLLENEFNVKVTKHNPRIPEELPKVMEEVKQLVPGASGLIWSTFTPLTEEILDKAGSQLKIVANINAGTDMIPYAALKARNIKLTNTPTVLNAATADVALGLILAASRRFKENLVQVESGKWDMSLMTVLGQDLRGSTVGVIGLGGIGQAIVKRLSGFEVQRFIYTGRTQKPEAKSLNCEYVDIDTIWKESDFIILSCPLTEQTKNIVNETSISKMKTNVVLVNIGRGGLVDQDALYKALKSGKVWSAGLDVTVPEPLPPNHPLLTLPNCFILPHIGSKTIKTRTEMAELAAKNLIAGVKEQPLLTEVKL